MTVAITGKQFTVSYNAVSGTAQITSGTIEESASSETVQTLGGKVAISQGVESTVSCDFLYDGNVAGGGFYAALKAALNAGAEAAIAIDGDGSDWAGDALVTSLSVEFPADGASTCSAEFTVSGEIDFTAGT